MSSELKTIAVPKAIHDQLKKLAEKKSKELGGIKVPLYLVIKEALQKEVLQQKNNDDGFEKNKDAPDEKQRYCKTCGAPLPPNFAGDYCPDCLEKMGVV